MLPMPTAEPTAARIKPSLLENVPFCNEFFIGFFFPLSGGAVTIAARTAEMKCTVESLMERAQALDGVLRVVILASE